MNRKTFVFLALFLCSSLHLWAVVVDVQFTADFNTLFASGGVWNHLTQSEVESEIIDFMEADLNPRGIYIGTNNVDIIAQVGGYYDNKTFGVARTGIGSLFYSPFPEVKIFSTLYANLVEFQGANATVPRIARAIGHTATHEVGHACNLFHAHAYETYDPYDTGAVDGDYKPKVSNALKVIYENDFEIPDGEVYPIVKTKSSIF